MPARHRPRADGGTAIQDPDHSAPIRVAPQLLDAAERVYGLTMNGGLEHAYALAGPDFDAAVAGLDALGAATTATVLRRALNLFTHSPETANDTTPRNWTTNSPDWTTSSPGPAS